MGCYLHSTVEIEELAACACVQERLRRKNAPRVEVSGYGKLLRISK